MSKFEKGKYADNKDRIKDLYQKHNSSIKVAEALEEETGISFSDRKIRDAVKSWGVESFSDSNEYKTPSILTAYDDSNNLMDIDTYCEYYKLPRKDVSSYKLVTHTGIPFYNLVFREQKELEEIDLKAVIDSLSFRALPPTKQYEVKFCDYVTRLIYTDTHIAMCTDEEATAMYATPWNKSQLMDTLSYMCEEVVKNKVGDVLYIDDLGDLLDGWEGYTTRGGHKLPQNMSSQEAFKVALEFKMVMLDILQPHFQQITCHNVCADNHSGRFAMILNHAFKRLAEATYSNVQVTNYEKFLDHYFIGRHAFVLTHGKDHKSLKFGFKPKLDPIQIEKIDHYLKHNEKGNIFKESDFIWVDKGDSHLMLFDYSSAQDFAYMNYPALSPSSEWVQSNFKKGDRGFVIQQIDTQDKNIKLLPILM